MNFLDSLNINLNEFHLKKILEIDNFDFSATLKKVENDLGDVSNEFLDKGLENLKRYYVVALLDPNNEHAVSSSVDPFWHSHILHTREYIHFSQKIFNQYIHHEPLDKHNNPEVLKIEELYDYTLNIYSKIFKNVDKEWWPHIDGDSTHGPVVCKHMYITDSEIRKFSLFGAREGTNPTFNLNSN
jgi:hypothetical protein